MPDQKTKFDDGTWKHEIRKISDLHPNPDNPRVITKETLKGLKKSMEKNGYTHRIIVDKHNMILSGHARWLVFKEKDPTAEIEVLAAQRELTPEEIQNAVIGHNVDGGEWNIEDLQMKFDPVMLEEYGLNFDKSEDYDTKEVVEVDTPDTPEEPKSKLGDIYQLGNHRLMCGSATEPEDIKKLMNGKKADLLLTDPPYNVDYKGSNGLKIQNDDMEDENFQEFLTKAFVIANANMKAGACFYIWYGDVESYNFYQATRNTGWKTRECLQWIKNSLVLGRHDYQIKHEPCLYGWTDGATHTWNGGRKQTTAMEAIDLMNEEELRKAYKELVEQLDTSVIYEDKPKANKVHPTMKPIKLMARLIRNSTKQEEIVLDLFAGSGSTLIACEQTNRTCYTTELDPKYVDVIIKRWEDFTGKRAIKIN